MSNPVLEISSAGPKDGSVLVFLHGWPDGTDVWDAQVAELSRSYRCLKVLLPGFADSKLKGNWDFSALSSLLAASLPKDKFILLGHDWGAILAYIFEQQNPERVKALITLDVGPHVNPESPGHALFLVGYQAWLIAAFGLGKILPGLGDWMTRLLATGAGAKNPQRAKASMNYPYLNLWLKILRGQSLLPKNYLPKCPILFLFGRDKRYSFHDSDWTNRVNEMSRSRSAGIKGGHWFLQETPDITNETIRQWLSEIEAAE